MTPAILPCSIQIYSLRNLGSLDAMLDCIKAAGHTHVELIGSQLDDAAATRAALGCLRPQGFVQPCGHGRALRDKLPAVIAACKTIGFTQLFMPSVPAERAQQPTATYWLALGP